MDNWLEKVKNGLDLSLVPEESRDYSVCMAAVKYSGLNLGEVPIEYQDEDLCLAAVRQNGEALYYVDPERKSFKVCVIAASNSDRALEDVPPNLDWEKVRFYGLLLRYKDPVRMVKSVNIVCR